MPANKNPIECCVFCGRDTKTKSKICRHCTLGVGRHTEKFYDERRCTFQGQTTQQHERTFTMSTISNRMPEVTIEYTSRNKRVTKHFTDAYAGRRFFATKLKDGKEPKVVNKQQTKLEQLKAMPIIGNAYHDSARFALCNEIIFDTTLSVEDRHEALVEIERTMGLEELTPTTSLEKKLEEVEQYILDTQ